MKMHRHSLPMQAPRLTQRSTVQQRLKGDTWMRLRAKVLERDAGLCRCAECVEQGRTRVAHEVDHIVPLEQGGSNDPANLQSINRECHRAKSARERAAFGSR